MEFDETQQAHPSRSRLDRRHIETNVAPRDEWEAALSALPLSSEMTR